MEQGARLGSINRNEDHEMRLIILNTAIVAGLTAAVAVHAQQKSGGPSRADMDKVVAALGVEHDDFRSCMPRPERGGSRPSESERKKAEEKALSCLQKANPELTADQFRAAMKSMPRPGGQRG